MEWEGRRGAVEEIRVNLLDIHSMSLRGSRLSGTTPHRHRFVLHSHSVGFSVRHPYVEFRPGDTPFPKNDGSLGPSPLCHG